MGVDFLTRLFTPYFIFTSIRGRERSSLLLTTINVLTMIMVFFVGYWEAMWPLLRHLKHLMLLVLSWELVLGVDFSMVLPLFSLGFEGAAPKFPWVLKVQSPKFMDNSCRNVPFAGEAHGCAFQRRKDARSRHQRLVLKELRRSDFLFDGGYVGAKALLLLTSKNKKK